MRKKKAQGHKLDQRISDMTFARQLNPIGRPLAPVAFPFPLCLRLSVALATGVQEFRILPTRYGRFLPLVSQESTVMCR